MNKKEVVEQNKIFEVISGSHAHGTNTPASDLDIKGIFMFPPEVFLSLFKVEEEVSDKNQDVKFYDIAKFLKLLVAQNPNIIEILWTEDINYRHPVMDILFSKREKFLSRKIADSFAGYATQQLKRLMGHQKWLVKQNNGLAKLRSLHEANKISTAWLKEVLDKEMFSRLNIVSDNGIETTLAMNHYLCLDDINLIANQSPSLLNFVTYINGNGRIFKGNIEELATLLQELSATKINHEIYGLWYDPTNTLKRGVLTSKSKNVSFIDIEEKKLNDIAPEYKGEIVVNFATFKGATESRKKFHKWRKERNEARASLEERMGFDGKHAAHLIRLLRMAEEVLTQHKVIVKRPDAQELLAIRNGAWSLERIIAYAEEKNKQIQELCKTSDLREEVDREMADQVYREMLSAYFKINLTGTNDSTSLKD